MTITAQNPVADEAADGKAPRSLAGRLLATAVTSSARTQHAWAIAIYLVGALYVTFRLWYHIDTHLTSSNAHDYYFFQFVFTHAAHAFTNFENPLFNSHLNAPFGVNMMANTSFLGVAIPLIPVTLIWGPNVSFVIALIAGFAGTAIAWYFFFRRHVTERWTVALAAGALIGFAPSMLSHGNAHPNLVAQFMVPLIISWVIRLKEDPSRPVRKGFILAAMLVYQAFLNEEILLYTALVCALIVVVYLLGRRDALRRLARPFLVALTTAGALSGLVLAYPLWFQFFGPQSYRGPFNWAKDYGIDAASLVAYADESLFGTSGIWNPLSTNPTEQNTFFGWPLCLFSLILGLALWRTVAARIALVVGVGLLLASLGDSIKINNVDTGITGPWRVVSHLPLFDSIIVTRMAMGITAAMAVILAIAADRLITAIKASDRGAARLMVAVCVTALAITFVPIAPTPLPAEAKTPPPAFFTNGTWRQYVKDGSIVPVPQNWGGNIHIDWLVATKGEAWVADGYFIGPYGGVTGGQADFGAPIMITGELLKKIWVSGEVPLITAKHREQARADLRIWQADIVVLGPEKHRDELRRTVSDLLERQPAEVDGVLVWDVTDLVPSKGQG